MKMDDEKLKCLLQEGMKHDADCIMAQVNSDPNMKDVIAPEDLHTNLMKQIKEHEAEVEREQENQVKEEQELIRLGKIYKKKRARRKYIVLIAAVLCALGVGTISFGDGKKVFSEMKRMLGDREQTVVNTKGSEGTVVDEISDEEKAYEKIEDTFGFSPVEMYYLPEGMEFVDIVIEDSTQNMRLYYEDIQGKTISYSIMTNYRQGSIGIDVEDTLVGEYEKDIKGTTIKMLEYVIEESNVNRWMINFRDKNVQYSIVLTGIEKEEVEKIIENLYFS